MRVAALIDDPAGIVEPGRPEKTRDVEDIGQPVDAHREIALEFVDQILREIGVGALVIDIDRDDPRLGHEAGPWFDRSPGACNDERFVIASEAKQARSDQHKRREIAALRSQ